MPLAGRNQSLAVIDALLQGLGETSGGTRGAALLVNADEGMGKTALVNEVENRTILLSEQTPDAPDALHALVTVRTKGHANRAWQSLLPMRGVVKQLISKYSESLGEPVAGGAVHCALPAAPAQGLVRLRVAHNAQQYSAASLAFDLYAPLPPLALSPSTGPALGSLGSLDAAADSGWIKTPRTLSDHPTCWSMSGGMFQ